jgi:hypothetical protein
MNLPTPAIVTEDAARRLPRLALWLFSLAYLLPGFFGREPWKREEISAFAVMLDLASGQASWAHPSLLGLTPRSDGPLVYWLGASLVSLAPDAASAQWLVRLPFIGLGLLTLACTWYAIYHLARHPLAQPVAFAFGGEARPTDYARAVADGGLLALIASLGLAQLLHEVTPATLQLPCAALLFFGAAALPYRARLGAVASVGGLIGLALSGAPSLAMMLGGVAAVMQAWGHFDSESHPVLTPRRIRLAIVGAGLLATATLATVLGAWRWRLELHLGDWSHWQGQGRLFLWFVWPTWPLALWTLWRWRAIVQRWKPLGVHVWWPLGWVGVLALTTVLTPSGERSLLLSLPAWAALAAFALPTFSRSAAALIDWFTLLFFSGCALVIWVVWLSLQTGFPAQPAANVARLAPGFVHHFSATLFFIALIASLTWAALVKWRISRHRSALWKSMILPAGGAALGWLLLMTLWLPLLDYARSYLPMVQALRLQVASDPGCVTYQGLDTSQAAALRVHGADLLPDTALRTQGTGSSCPWLLVNPNAHQDTPLFPQDTPWVLQGQVGHPADRDETLFLYHHHAP